MHLGIGLSITGQRLAVAGDDTEAPTAPANLQATATSTTAIDLTWDASTDNVAVTGYNIYQDNVLIDTSATNSYSVTGLDPLTEYEFEVSAFDAANNESARSDPATETTHGTISVSVAASADDASELNSNTSVTINATTITITDSADQQIAAFRFLVPTLTQGATILSPWRIQFTAGDTNTATTAMADIFGLDEDATAAFQAVNANISGRATTTATVAWTIPGWTSGNRTSDQLTPDLTAIVQEIVDRPGFNGVLGFRFRRRTGGSATRIAAALDHATLQEATISGSFAP